MARVIERDCFYYIIIQTYEVGLHSRRHPIEIDAGSRPFAHNKPPFSPQYETHSLPQLGRVKPNKSPCIWHIHSIEYMQWSKQTGQ